MGGVLFARAYISTREVDGAAWVPRSRYLNASHIGGLGTPPREAPHYQTLIIEPWARSDLRRQVSWKRRPDAADLLGWLVGDWPLLEGGIKMTGLSRQPWLAMEFLE